MLRHITTKMLSPQYDSCSTIDHDDDYSADDVDNILSQSSMSPGPPSSCSGISFQGSLNSPATVIPTAVSMVDTTVISHPHNRLWVLIHRLQVRCYISAHRILILLHRHTGLWAPIWHPESPMIYQHTNLRVLLHHPTTAMRTAAIATVATEGEVIHRHSGLWAPVYLLTLHHSRCMIRL